MQENTPLLRVPVVGVIAAHPCVWSEFGAWKLQIATSTPDFRSVTVMLHVTFWPAAETFTEVGVNPRFVTAGGRVSGSDVTAS